MASLDWQSPVWRRRGSYILLAIFGATLIHWMVASQSATAGRWTTPNYEVVMAYYDEDIEHAQEVMSYISQSIPSYAKFRRTIYIKGKPDAQKRAALKGMSDEVIQLDNIGREGETYLTHIIRNYHLGLADYTLFVQPHLAWDFIFKPRLDMMSTTPNLGFLSFGPYVTQTAGKDVNDNVFPRMNDIYSMFREDFSPPHPVLAVWAGQFVVSRKRILENSFAKYQNLASKFHASAEHWIWQEGWGNNELSNPTLGHALERMWSVIFNCTDAKMAEMCTDSGPQTKQCICLD